MAYSFRLEDRTVGEGVRRIALGQIEAARDELHSHTLGPHRTVHQVRKRCKKLRALLRLVRPAFDAYGRENAAFRDMARPLSAVRDAGALVEAFDRLAVRFAGQVDGDLMASLRERLAARQSAMDVDDIAARLRAFEAALNKAEKRVTGWKLEAKGYEAVGKGMARTYARAQRDLKAAREDPQGEAMHEWRKRVKYHRLHARLLKAIWPAMMHAHIDVANGLSEQLGDHHDLFVFLEVLEAGDLIEDGETLGMFRGLILARQQRLAGEAFETASFLFSEAPEALEARWGGYWKAWRAAA